MKVSYRKMALRSCTHYDYVAVLRFFRSRFENNAIGTYLYNSYAMFLPNLGGFMLFIPEIVSTWFFQVTGWKWIIELFKFNGNTLSFSSSLGIDFEFTLNEAIFHNSTGIPSSEFSVLTNGLPTSKFLSCEVLVVSLEILIRFFHNWKYFLKQLGSQHWHLLQRILIFLLMEIISCAILPSHTVIIKKVHTTNGLPANVPSLSRNMFPHKWLKLRWVSFSPVHEICPVDPQVSLVSALASR